MSVNDDGVLLGCFCDLLGRVCSVDFYTCGRHLSRIDHVSAWSSVSSENSRIYCETTLPPTPYGLRPLPPTPLAHASAANASSCRKRLPEQCSQRCRDRRHAVLRWHRFPMRAMRITKSSPPKQCVNRGFCLSLRALSSMCVMRWNFGYSIHPTSRASQHSRVKAL